MTDTTTAEEPTVTTDTTTTADQPGTIPASTAPDATSASETPQDDSTEPDATDSPDDGLEDTGRDGRDAARYRARLRETETERDQLRDQLDAMRRAEVARMVEPLGLGAAALWAAGVEVDQLLDEQGTVDPGKVAEAVETARTALGIGAHQVKPGQRRFPSADGQGGDGGDVHDVPASQRRDRMERALGGR